MLLGLCRYLQSLNAPVFSNRLDLSRIMLAGHSFGGAACIKARRDIVDAGGPQPLAIGLLGPAVTGTGSTNIVSLAAAIAPNGLFVLKSTADHQVYNDPTDVYN
jgi:hypothetical protein